MRSTDSGNLVPMDHALWFDWLEALDCVKRDGPPLLKLL